LAYFLVASEEFRLCVIRGLPVNVQKGEYMVKEFLAKHVIETVELMIPTVKIFKFYSNHLNLLNINFHRTLVG